MEEELNIKKRIAFIVAILVVIGLFVIALINYTKDNPDTIQEACVWIPRPPGRWEDCVIKVLSDGTLEVIYGPLTIGPVESGYESEDFFDDTAKKRTKKLNKYEKIKINQLITKVKENDIPKDKNKPEYGNESMIIYAIIDDMEYRASFVKNDYNIYDKNDDLRVLTHELIKVCPYNSVGYLKHYLIYLKYIAPYESARRHNPNSMLDTMREYIDEFKEIYRSDSVALTKGIEDSHAVF